MKEVKNNKIQKGYNILKVSGIALLALVILVNIAGAEPYSNITFVTTGSSFSPIITVTGNPTIQWTFGDGSTSNSKSPNVNFGSAAARVNTLVVTPWSAVTKINIGYDGSDGGVAPSSSTIANLKQQNVIAVNGLENVAPSLQVWASSYNPITALDFSNFAALQTIECFSCRSLSTIKLHNVPDMSRLCIEQSNISYLDLSEAPSLADFRGASQKSSIYTINWGTTGANIWHICVRDNPQITGTIPFNQFPLLKQFFNWNDNQSGTIHITSTNLRDVESSNNYYNTAIFPGCFPTGTEGTINIDNNDLTNLDISNDPGLYYLNASFNSLNQAAVDGILQTLDSYKTNNGYLDLTGNAAPSTIGVAYANNLTARNWEVKISSKNSPPVASFTSNVTSGTVPLEIQFSDTSTNNPTTWSWDFGDGTHSNEKFPKHTYSSPGDYTVTLRVSNANGSDFKVAVITVLAQPFLPLANFSSNVTEGYVPLNVQFNDLSENTAERYWDFGDGTNSTEMDPTHTYSVAGNYSVNLTVSNTNGIASKNATINVRQAASSDSDGSTSGGSTSGGSTSGGNRQSGSISSGSIGIGGGVSPELINNIESRELSKAFVANGNYVKFDFPMNATPVVYIAFGAKKTSGMTTTIVETLNKRSILVSELPSDEVYKHVNIWVGNNGFINSKNIEDAIVCFKVEKSWVQDKMIDKSSITLNRYSDKTWNQLPTSLSSEDDNYLYLTAQTPGFSPFAITGKIAAAENVQPAAGDKTQPAVNVTQNITNTGSTSVNVKPALEKELSSNSPGKESTETLGFLTVFGAISLNIILLACLLYFFLKK